MFFGKNVENFKSQSLLVNNPSFNPNQYAIRISYTVATLLEFLRSAIITGKDVNLQEYLKHFAFLVRDNETKRYDFMLNGICISISVKSSFYEEFKRFLQDDYTGKAIEYFGSILQQ